MQSCVRIQQCEKYTCQVLKYGLQHKQIQTQCSHCKFEMYTCTWVETQNKKGHFDYNELSDYKYKYRYGQKHEAWLGEHGAGNIWMKLILGGLAGDGGTAVRGEGEGETKSTPLTDDPPLLLPQTALCTNMKQIQQEIQMQKEIQTQKVIIEKCDTIQHQLRRTLPSSHRLHYAQI